MSSKVDKENHVSGHTGTTIVEIHTLLLVWLLSYWLNKLLWFNCRFSKITTVYLVEYTVLVFPLLISCTFTEFIPFLLAILSGFILLLSAFGTIDKTRNLEHNSTHESFVVSLRSCLQLATICAILAVDFHVFPRRFAKTESFGTSLMDLGAGAFVFTSGLVAGPRLRVAKHSSLLITCRMVIPCLILGISRALTTKAVDYQEHVTEYGVHWNFFITLGVLPLLNTVQLMIIPNVNMIWVAFSVMLAYQYILENGLANYIISAPRNDLISMNREGIFSLFGFYSIFLFAAELGAELLTLKEKNVGKLRTKRHSILIKFGVTFSVLLLVVQYFNMKISRRMSNFSFVIWVVWTGITFLYGFFVIDSFLVPFKHTPLISHAIDRNQLATFLVANLITGCVNLISDTLSFSNTQAFLILMTYMFVVVIPPLIWNSYKLKIKL